MIKIYSLKGCPMCEHAKEVLSKKHIPFEQIMDTAEMEKMGISHVPVLELENGNLLSGRALIQYLNTL